MSLSGQNKMAPKMGIHCAVVYGKLLGVPLNILGSVFTKFLGKNVQNIP